MLVDVEVTVTTGLFTFLIKAAVTREEKFVLHCERCRRPLSETGQRASCLFDRDANHVVEATWL